ncbi:MAG: L,D-transpeptidase family protein [Deltaproteobacteria bacterium]|nr:L,D-transpeptidase family protein [Deltaproteobacteria bacterium]
MEPARVAEKAPPSPAVKKRASAFGADLPSFVVKDEEAVRAEPTDDSEQLGTLLPGARISVVALGEQRKACRWMEIEPAGWICARGEPSKLAPSADVYPRLWARGYDGRVFRDEDDIRANGGYKPAQPVAIVRPWPVKPITIDKKQYMRTADGEYVPWTSVPRYWGDEYAGVALDGAKTPKLPIAWTWFHETHEKPTPVHAGPSRKDKVVRSLPLRARVDLLAEEGKWVRIGDGEWVAREDLKIIRGPAAPPPEVTGANEVWVDVVLSQQALVLYRGKTPIHATLVSTGREKYPTPTGIFRIKKKTPVSTFQSPRPDLIDYKIEDVAWAMHISDVYAIHGAWWNRGFGVPISLGCVDVPATDIRVVYEHVEPKIPPGWWQAHATKEHPGSVVRIRLN